MNQYTPGDPAPSAALLGLAASQRDPAHALLQVPPVVRLVAHRGSGHDRNDPTSPPENTVTAVRHGFAAGADAVEVDVWCTADGVPVVHHDHTTDRTTDLPGRRITEVQYAELAPHSAGAWKADRWKDVALPTLAEVVAEVPPDRALIVEIEEGPQVVERIHAVMAAAGLADHQVVYISFNFDTIAAAKRLAPQHRAFWILDTLPRWQVGGWVQGHRRGPNSERHGADEPLDLDWVLDQALSAGLDGLDTLFAYPPGMPQRITQEMLWMVWTANDPRAIDQCLADGAWAITTDNTAAVLDWIHAAGARTVTETGSAF